MASFTIKSEEGIFEYNVSYTLTTSPGSATLKITGVHVTALSSGWGTWDLTPSLYFYLIPNRDAGKPQNMQNQSTEDNIKAYITGKGGVYNLHTTNKPNYPNSKGGTTNWAKSYYSLSKKFTSTNETTIPVTVGIVVRNTSGRLDGVYTFNKVINVTVPTAYTPPSGLSLSISETTTTSFKVTARWTGGEGKTDGACRVTVNGTSKIIDDDPVVFTGLTPNVSYTVSGELYDKKNSPSTVRDTASASAHTTITTPSGWTGVGSNNGSIWATATSSNGGSFYYQYRINNGGWSGWQNSGTFSGLTPNVSYSIQARAVSNTGGGTSGALSGTIHTTIATPNGWTGVGSNTNSVWATGTSSNGGSFYYQYRIYKNGAWSAWQNSGTFSSLSSNTNYSLQVRAVSNTGGGTSGALSGSRWTYPVIGSLTVSLQSGQEHDRINASAAASVSSSYDQYSFAINSNSWQTYGGSSTYWSGLNGNTTYTIWVKMRNTASGFESASVSRQITTWHDPLTNLKVNLVNRWFWYLLVNCSYTYTGTISKFEFDIGGQGYQNKGTSNSHSRGTTSPTGSPKLAYNTNYTCKVRVTDNHGRQYTASATYKTLDERPLYVNGVLREVKLIKSDGSVHYVTPNLLSVVQSNGTVTNMNKIINNDNRTEYR